MTRTFTVSREEQLGPVAAHLLEVSKDCPLILLRGEMGTGKTTLVREMMRQCGAPASSSPTFSIVNQYDTAEGVFYHFDLYRIQEAEELLDLGFEEYLETKNRCLIEWPDIALDYLYTPYIEVNLQLEADLSRAIKITRIAS